MHNGSIEWADGLLEVTLAWPINYWGTRAPDELLFRDRTSYINWLNSQKHEDITIGVSQEDPTQAPIYMPWAHNRLAWETSHQLILEFDQGTTLKSLCE
jgi:hypothetical protein